MRAIRNGMEAAGIPVQESKGEWGPGQEELNLVYAEALEMADRHVIYKNGVKEIGWLQGKAVSFMPKWRADLAGNSCHIHGSLWDGDDRPAFSDGKGETELFRQFLAGLLAVGGEMTYFLAPYVNSYKRFVAGSFAPTNLVWSRDNRTSRLSGAGPWAGHADRMPGRRCRREPLSRLRRVPGGRACTGSSRACRCSPSSRATPTSRATSPRCPPRCTTPSTGWSARRCCARPSATMSIEHYVHAGRWEQAVYDKAVTDWELTRYFERA